MLKKSGIWKDIEKKGGCVNHTFCLTDLSVLLSPKFVFFPGQFTIFAPSDAAIEKLGADLKTKLQRQGLLFLDGSLYNDDILNHRYRCKFLGHLCIEAPPEKFLFCYFSGDLCAQDILR